MMRGRPQDQKWVENRIGRPVLWEQSTLRTTRRYDGSTRVFDGSPEDRGRLYRPGRQIRALLTSDKSTKEHGIAGAVERGEAFMTFDSALPIGPEDRITFLDMPVYQEVELHRGAGATDSFPTTMRVKMIQFVQNDSANFEKATDWRIVRNNNRDIIELDWSQAIQAPTTGEKYIVAAEILPAWIVAGQPLTRSFGTKQLLKKALLRRDDGGIRR